MIAILLLGNMSDPGSTCTYISAKQSEKKLRDAFPAWTMLELLLS